MNWLWAYLRKKAADSLLAGVHDALTSGSGPTGLSEEQAARAARALLGVPDGSAPATAGTSSPSPPQLLAPNTEGVDANGPATPGEPPRRGPGRPRKFQEPPQ